MNATQPKPAPATPDAPDDKDTIEHLRATLEIIRDTWPGNFATDLDAIDWIQRQAKEALS